MKSQTAITNGTRRPRVKRHRLVYGQLASQRRAFAITSDDATPLGTRHFVTVWVQAKHGCRIMREVAYVTPHDRNYRWAFALIMQATVKQVKNNSPAYIARKLGW
jgi:hypothetical protein